jgi:hypothetical protein
MQVHGVVAHEKNIVQLDKISMETKWRSGTPPGFEMILHSSLHEPRGKG